MKRFKIPVIKGNVLGVHVYRGFAPLYQVSKISAADVYDTKTNPMGTQRDLSLKHAREAYDYVLNKSQGFWPEVLLNVRDKSVIKFKPIDESEKFGYLIIDVDKIENSKDIAISRIDGNHRLFYGDGHNKKYDKIRREVSFCLAYELDKGQEISIFKDINNNQKRMNTSHLDNIEARLTPEELLKAQDPQLFIARKLGQDSDSPLFERVYEGGKKKTTEIIPLRTLKTGLEYMLSRTTKLKQLNDADAQYKLILNFFKAVKKWNPKAWDEPKKYITLRGVGLWATCFIGADVIDRTLTKGKFSVDQMTKILKSGREWDWSNTGTFQGYSGRGGAVKISDLVTSEFQEEGQVSVSELLKQIMKD